MELMRFENKIRTAAGILASLCSTGEPTEKQVKEATHRVDLPVTFENESYVIDPVRLAVFITAYRPARMRATVEQVVEKAWRWHETARLEVVA